MKYDTIIIGGGASGLCTAINAKTKDNTILIIEHNDKPGKKLLSTGNGKCNLTNTFCETGLFGSNPEGIYPYFTSGRKEFAETVISAFGAEDAVGFFENLGILTEDKGGYIYPRSEQAASVVSILTEICERRGIDMLLGYQPLKIEPFGGSGCRFIIDGEYICKNLVIAAGGMAAPKTGSDGSGYEIAKKFGHSIVPPRPALCGIKCSDTFFKDLAGVRSDGRITLFDKNKAPVISASGNLQLNSYGISGIPVFQISSELGRMLEAGEEVSVKIDFLPELSQEELADFIGSRETYGLSGLLNRKLAQTVISEARATAERHMNFAYAEICAAVIKQFKIHPLEMNPFSESQITAGGVCTDEIAAETMESRICRGLYFTGEIVDVNGICGGYNLQWAWATANVAAKAIKEEHDTQAV